MRPTPWKQGVFVGKEIVIRSCHYVRMRLIATGNVPRGGQRVGKDFLTLVIEIADSSLVEDHKLARLYGEAGSRHTDS